MSGTLYSLCVTVFSAATFWVHTASFQFAFIQLSRKVKQSKWETTEAQLNQHLASCIFAEMKEQP